MNKCNPTKLSQGVSACSLQVWISSQRVATFPSQQNVVTYIATYVATGMCVGRCVARLRRNVHRKVVATCSPQTYPSSQGPFCNARHKVVARFRCNARRKVLVARIFCAAAGFLSVRYSMYFWIWIWIVNLQDPHKRPNKHDAMTIAGFNDTQFSDLVDNVAPVLVIRLQHQCPKLWTLALNKISRLQPHMFILRSLE